MGRWDRFHEARRQDVAEWLSDQVVKTVSEELQGWPPPVELWNDLSLRMRYEPALGAGCPRPPAPVFRAAFKLARWELGREYEALDHFVRNDKAAEVTADARERVCLDFLHQWLTDSMLEILEVSEPIKRPHLIECLQRIEDHLFGPARSDGPAGE